VGSYTINLKLTDSQGAFNNYIFDLIINDTVPDTAATAVLAVVSEAFSENLLASMENTPDWNWLDQFNLAQAKGRSSPLPPLPPKVKF
jgi:hypothetical protein